MRPLERLAQMIRDQCALPHGDDVADEIHFVTILQPSWARAISDRDNSSRLKISFSLTISRWRWRAISHLGLTFHCRQTQTSAA